MIRKLILWGALLALVAACSSSPPAASTDAGASTPVSTATPVTTTPEPEESEAPASAGTGSTSALFDLLPDQIGGMDHGEDVDFGNNPMFQSLLQQQGGEALEDIEYIIRTWGDGEVTLSAMRIPSMPQPQLELIAKAMSGAVPGQGSAEPVTLGGKTVLRIEPSDAAGTAAIYMYFAEGAAFSVVGASDDLVSEVFAALP